MSNKDMQAAEKIVTDMLGATTISETIALVGWGTFDDLARQIKARLFGELVRRSQTVVEEYHLDLFSDAMRINEEVTGPCEFDWLVRRHGTYLSFDSDYANMARGMAGIESTNVLTTLYRVKVWCDESRATTSEIEAGVPSGSWHATFTVLDKHAADKSTGSKR